MGTELKGSLVIDAIQCLSQHLNDLEMRTIPTLQHANQCLGTTAPHPRCFDFESCAPSRRGTSQASNWLHISQGGRFASCDSDKQNESDAPSNSVQVIHGAGSLQLKRKAEHDSATDPLHVAPMRRKPVGRCMIYFGQGTENTVVLINTLCLLVAHELPVEVLRWG